MLDKFQSDLVLYLLNFDTSDFFSYQLL